MTCEELVAMLDREGSLITGEAAEHAQSCPSCREALDRWQAVHRELHAMNEEEVPPHLHSRLMAHVREAAEADERRKRPWFYGLRSAWAGPLLVLFLGVILGGFGLFEMLHPRPLNAPAGPNAVVAGRAAQGKARSTQRNAPLGQSPAPKSESPFQRYNDSAKQSPHAQSSTAVPSVPQDKSARSERLPSLFSSGSSSSGEEPSEPYQPTSRRSEDERDAAKAEGNPGAPAVRSMDSAAPPENELPPSSTIAPSAEGGLSAEVVCVLTPQEGRGPFITLQLPRAAAPPAGSPWTVSVEAGRFLARDAQGKQPLPSMEALESVLRPLHVPAGHYLLKRVSN